MHSATPAAQLWRLLGFVALTATLVALAMVTPGEVWHSVLN